MPRLDPRYGTSANTIVIISLCRHSALRPENWAGKSRLQFDQRCQHVIAERTARPSAHPASPTERPLPASWWRSAGRQQSVIRLAARRDVVAGQGSLQTKSSQLITQPGPFRSGLRTMTVLIRPCDQWAAMLCSTTRTEYKFKKNYKKQQLYCS